MRRFHKNADALGIRVGLCGLDRVSLWEENSMTTSWLAAPARQCRWYWTNTKCKKMHRGVAAPGAKGQAQLRLRHAAAWPDYGLAGSISSLASLLALRSAISICIPCIVSSSSL